MTGRGAGWGLCGVRVSVRLFGAFQVMLDGQALFSFESDKTRALLAYLACESPLMRRREHLAGLFWPDSSEKQARHSLSQAVYSLRAQLEAAFGAQITCLEITRSEVGFHPSCAVWVDRVEFERFLAECDKHPHARLETCQTCQEQMRQAAALYQGEFLRELSLRGCLAFDEWLTVTRERLHLQAMNLLGKLSASYEISGQSERALEYARRQIELDPLWESGTRQVMHLLAQRGSRSAALRQFYTLRQALHEELGVEPEAATQELADKLGQEVLRAPFSAQSRHNLPAPLTPFIGRQQDLEYLVNCLSQGSCRLITILGPGGSGKTRLALEAGRRLVSSFQDGVFLLRMDGLQSTQPLAAELARSLGLALQEQVPPRVLLQNFLSDKSLLLILDGFERFVELGSMMQDYLWTCPQVRILVTSRVRINLKSERVHALAGFDLPAPGSDYSLEDNEAVQFFLQAAQRVSTRRMDQTGELAAVADICRSLQGMPLALLLAAGWTGLYSPLEIAAQVRQNLDFLELNLGDLPERQRSLRASFEYSLNLLTPEERRIMLILSIFRDGFELQSAAQVAGCSRYDLLALADKSFIQRTDNGRCRLHELIRQFAAERLALEVDPEQVFARRHAGYYLDLVSNRLEGMLSSRQTESL